uniref:acyl-CoA dehydrogenase family protein n=1 Tax=Oxalicibacterium faecigallinarum TaxID=573741 RepID=UPI0035937776
MLPTTLQTWLQAQSDTLDRSQDLASEVLPKLSEAGLFGVGVPQQYGGSGGDVRDAIHAIADVAEYSLTAAFVFWGHRTFIEYLLHSPNHVLAERWIARLAKGERAGATGLSNAMKFLSGIESLQITATPEQGGFQLDGSLAWVTNLRKEGFIAAAAVASSTDAPPAIVCFCNESEGVQRSADLDLMALRSSNTAAVKLKAVHISEDEVIHGNAREYLPGVRPGFLGMQCGMSIGLARASLRAAEALCAATRSQLNGRVSELQQQLNDVVEAMTAGILDGSFKTKAAGLFRIRITLAEIVQQAVMLELQASGGRAYLQDNDRNFARRWRESAFIPIVTPSLTQLQIELQKQAATSGA